jgi:hypothetical protein
MSSVKRCEECKKLDAFAAHLGTRYFIIPVATLFLWIIAVEGLAQAESERRRVQLYESDKP